MVVFEKKFNTKTPRTINAIPINRGKSNCCLKTNTETGAGNTIQRFKKSQILNDLRT